MTSWKLCLELVLPAVLISVQAEAKDETLRKYALVISEEEMAPAGEPVKTLTINGGIPGPTLYFRVGETAVISVKNTLEKQDTSIHWHGLLVPNAQDGVPYLTTPPIRPGTEFTYRFKLTHSGTYWYHSHTGLQEQRGMYGAIVVRPEKGARDKVDREYVLQLSDWTNEKPSSVMKTLMRGSEWYAVKKKNVQSISGAIKAKALRNYIKREWSRMPPMDLSDVAYDAFLINGKRSLSLEGKPGEKIKLRIINSGASTYFYLDSATGPMTIVAADGPAVKPVKVSRFLIAIAETYDVIVTIPKEGQFEFRATAQDGSGHVSLFLGTGKKHLAEGPPRANIYDMDEMMETALVDGDTSHLPRPLPPYPLLKSTAPTQLNPRWPLREMTLRLTGDMKRYIWSFNGKTLSEESTILVKKGEILRMHLINDTMMHHPIHLHGHFFRVLNGKGDHAPMKHTVDVHPMGTHSIEFEADQEKDWLFHCHILYHMDAGMARVIRYEGTSDSPEPKLDPKLINPVTLMGEISTLSNMSEGMIKVMRGRDDFVLDGTGGYRNKNDYEVDLTWQHYFNPDVTSFIGYRLTDIDHARDRVIAGFYYRLPLLVKSSVTMDTEGDLRLGIEKDVRVFDRTSLYFDVEYDTNTDWEGGVGLEHMVSRDLSFVFQHHSIYGVGGGIVIRF